MNWRQRKIKPLVSSKKTSRKGRFYFAINLSAYVFVSLMYTIFFRIAVG